jgi:hypothetical protein
MATTLALLIIGAVFGWGIGYDQAIDDAPVGCYAEPLDFDELEKE